MTETAFTHTPRIYLDLPLAVGETLVLPEPQSHHLARTLRLGLEERLRIFNGQGCDFTSHIVEIGKRLVTIRIDDAIKVNNESPLAVTLIQGVCGNDRMDWLLQKAVELGVTNIIPLITQKSIIRLDQERTQKKLQHWRNIIIAATEQSGRANLCTVEAPLSWQSWRAQPPSTSFNRFLLSPRADLRLKQLQLQETSSLQLLVGPEGGLTQAEEQTAIKLGFQGLSLGPRILRAETAGLAAVAALQSMFGDL